MITRLKIIQPILLLLFCGITGCSWYVRDTNIEYANAVNEINQNAQILTGYELPNSFKFDGINGHRHFRFSGALIEEDKPRGLEIYIPNNNEIGRPVIQETNEPIVYEKKDELYLYVSVNKRYTDRERNTKFPFIALNIDLKEDKDGFFSVQRSKIYLSFISGNCDASEELCCESCIQPQEDICERKWEVTPQLNWYKRKKEILWAMRTRYFFTVPVDAVAVSLIIGIAIASEDDD